MRHFEDQAGFEPGADAFSPAVLSAGALVSVALAVAYAVGAGSGTGEGLFTPLMAAAVAHLGWAGLALVSPSRSVAGLGLVLGLGLAAGVALPVVRADHQHSDVADPPSLVVPDVPGGETAAAPGSTTQGADHADHGDHGGEVVTSLYDPRLTERQREAARRLIDDTSAGMAQYPDVDSVVAAGYVSIGDGLTGFEHFINTAFIIDGVDLDPSRIESIVARVNPDGSRDIVSAMYLMAPGSTMEDVPDIAGPLTVWHDHQDLCWEGIRVVGRVGPDGSCARGEFRGTAPMMHVWLVPHPCGPFAGLEGHGGSCAHDH